MKASEALRAAAEYASSRTLRADSGCWSIAAVIDPRFGRRKFPHGGLHVLIKGTDTRSALYQKAMDYFELFIPSADYECLTYWFDDQEQRITALLFAAAIAESEGD